MNTDDKPSIVVIDDDGELLAKLQTSLERNLSQDDADIRIWMPNEGQDPFVEFNQLVDDSTVLVVADYDLTKNGVTGLFGVLIVSWCQARSIPVGDFSRANVISLPSEPNLFELRVPTDVEEAASY